MGHTLYMTKCIADEGRGAAVAAASKCNHQRWMSFLPPPRSFDSGGRHYVIAIER